MPSQGIFEFRVLTPEDGATTEVPWAAVLGVTVLDAIVSVNGVVTAVDERGEFTQAVALDEGANLLETVASEPLGDTASDTRIVFYLPPAVGLPFQMLYPADGIEVNRSTISVLGGTALDTIVTVDGTIAQVDERGLFTAEIALEEGLNLIEIVASEQFGGEQRSAFVTVIYLT